MPSRTRHTSPRRVSPFLLAGLLLGAVSACEAPSSPNDLAFLGREYGWPGTGNDRDLYLALSFDTAATILTGQWLLAYQVTRATDEGRFTGSATGNRITLELNPSPGCTGGYHLEATVSFDARSIHGRITPQAGTLPVGPADTITLIPSDVFEFPEALKLCH